MAKEIRWSDEAEISFDNIVNYLQIKWTDKEIEKFVTATHKTIRLIAENPNLFRSSNIENLREALITKHNLLLYKEFANHIEIITIFDTRQHPNKKKL